MKLNNDRYQLLLSSYKHKITNIGQSQIWETKNRDRDMKFDEYMQEGSFAHSECKFICKHVNFKPKTSKVSYKSIYRIFT